MTDDLMILTKIALQEYTQHINNLQLAEKLADKIGFDYDMIAAMYVRKEDLHDKYESLQKSFLEEKMSDISDKVTRVERHKKINKFNSAMYGLFNEYIPTEAYCLRKLMFMTGGSTFDNFNHEDTNHPLQPCVVCDDYGIDSGKECYKSEVLIKLKHIGAVPDLTWRLKTYE